MLRDFCSPTRAARVRITHILLLSAATLSLAGCSHEVSAPSLMPRAVEKQPIDMPVTAAIEADTPVDPALQVKIAAQVAAAQAGDKAFTAQQAETEKAVARASGAARGSDAWVEAQEAVTALESARIAVRDAAAAIDALRDDPANAAPGNRNAIDAAAAEMTALETKEVDAVAALNKELG
jgi:hypothetical protein